MNNLFKRVTSALITVFSAVSIQAATAPLTLDLAIELANQQDERLEKSTLVQRQYEAKAGSYSERPDPTLEMAIVNLPTDGFAFDQEPMTQFKVSLGQAFARGEEISIKRQQDRLSASTHPLIRADVKARNRTAITALWLSLIDVKKQQQRLTQDITLLDQLKQAAEAAYASGYSKTQQQDIVAIEIEKARLLDQVLALGVVAQDTLGKLHTYLQGTPYTGVSLASLSLEIPSLSLSEGHTKSMTLQNLAEHMSAHPAVAAIGINIKTAEKGIELAKQAYKPKWRVNASYAYRSDDQLNQSRADFFSVGVGVDLPMFSNQEQDENVKASKLAAASVETDRRLLLKQFVTNAQRLENTARLTQERADKYQSTVLQQLKEHADLTLSAYTNDEGAFSDAIRARIQLTEAQIQLIKLNTQHQKTLNELHYYLVPSTNTTENQYE